MPPGFLSYGAEAPVCKPGLKHGIPPPRRLQAARIRQARNSPQGLFRVLSHPGNSAYLITNSIATSRVAGWMSRKRPDSALIVT